MQQNTKMMDQFIHAQDRRDLDPALMDIPTFTGDEPEKCLEWITRIRNVCRQSGRSFQQELTNKSGLVVQNFLSSLDTNITENRYEGPLKTAYFGAVNMHRTQWVRPWRKLSSCT